ncbi:hypothetical protein [Actinacidiphila acidipaludis]|uniref:Uncharacterized protein n=1 Tax=Actinacidiphila acidipaludis TaxID=2873382 RepID=A0ABS7QBI4_9ACTN|nr:hypothetical protein [Streptomyces acidipaludis]MBY8880540.1 hypothetical protein [Streptomyces acidipaludis]
MPTRRTGLTLAAVAALLAGATTAVAAQSDGHGSGDSRTATPVSASPSGIRHLATAVDLPAGAWTDVPLEVTLRRPGTYALDADVRGRLQGDPPVNTYITARLWDVTSGTAVPDSERLVYQVVDSNAGEAPQGGNQTAPITEQIRITRPTTIRLQALHTDSVGTATDAQVASDTFGRTALRYQWVGF